MSAMDVSLSERIEPQGNRWLLWAGWVVSLWPVSLEADPQPRLSQVVRTNRLAGRKARAPRMPAIGLHHPLHHSAHRRAGARCFSPVISEERSPRIPASVTGIR
jgi:hypothetical protein